MQRLLGSDVCAHMFVKNAALRKILCRYYAGLKSDFAKHCYVYMSAAECGTLASCTETSNETDISVWSVLIAVYNSTVGELKADERAVVWPGNIMEAPKDYVPRPVCGIGINDETPVGGEYFDENLLQCKPCPIGTFMEPCAGSSCVNQPQCNSCNNKPGYQDETGQTGCKPCPAGSHRPSGSNFTSISDCVCREGFFVDQLKSLISASDTGLEYDFLRRNNFTFRNWCHSCAHTAHEGINVVHNIGVACVRACVRACMHACMCTCVLACVCADAGKLSFNCMNSLCRECTECPAHAWCNGTTDGKGMAGQPHVLPAGCTEDCASRVWLPAPPYADIGYWSLPEPHFRTEMFECDSNFCEGGFNLEGVSVCAAGNKGIQCAQCKPEHFKFLGKCRACPNIAANLLQVLGMWLLWYWMNAILCENMETADQWFSFVQMGNVIGEFRFVFWDISFSIFLITCFAA